MGLSWQPVCPPTRVLRPSVDTPGPSGQDFVSDQICPPVFVSLACTGRQARAHCESWLSSECLLNSLAHCTLCIPQEPQYPRET